MYLLVGLHRLQNRRGLNEMLDGILASNHHLEHSQNASSQRVIVIVLRIDFLKRLESLHCIVEMPHLVGVVSDQQ